MGLFDVFKKQKIDKTSEKEKARDKKKKEQTRLRKEREEEIKKRQFQAVGSAGSSPEKKADKEEPTKEAKKEEKKKTRKSDTKRAPRILIKPIISEKATALGVFNQYVFQVSSGANKIEVKKAIESLYEVTPIKVNMMNKQGRQVRYGRSEGRTSAWKKAVITLKQGDKIDIYSV